MTEKLGAVKVIIRGTGTKDDPLICFDPQCPENENINGYALTTSALRELCERVATYTNKNSCRFPDFDKFLASPEFQKAMGLEGV